MAFVFVKQKTAYEMRISDWSSDVCSFRSQIGERRHLATAASTAERSRLDAATRQLHLRIKALDRQIALQRARVASSRRSFAIIGDARQKNYVSRIDFENQHRAHLDEEARLQELAAERATLGGQVADNQARSEEHTSELQALMRISYAVFCLKKKKRTTTQ